MWNCCRWFKALLSLTAVLVCSLCVSAWDGRVIDEDTQLPLSGVRMSLFADNDIVFVETVSGPDGKVSMVDSLISNASKIEFSVSAYVPKAFSDTIPTVIELKSERMIELGEVVVTGLRSTYTMRNGAIAYEVSRDSLMRRRTAWDALRQTPLLIVNAQGGISAIPGYSGVEFRMNGLRDAMFSDGNFLQSALETIPASLVERVVVTTRNTPKGEVLEVNFVTKARLEGIAGQISSSVSDSRWANTLYGITKIRRLTLSASYMNSWNWSHMSTERRDEYRFDSSDLYRYQSETRDRGYKADIHRYKLYATYDIDDRTLLTVDAMMFRKTDPHTDMDGSGSITDSSGSRALGYKFFNRSRQSTDAEYDVYLSCQRSLGGGGHTYAVYNFYSRPVRTVSERDYDVALSPDADAGKYKDFLYDSYNITKNRYYTHTLQWEWEKMVSRRSALRLDVKGRWLTDNQTGSQKLEDAVMPDLPQQEILSDSRHSQGFGYVQASYRYFGDNFEIQPGTVLQGYYDRQKLSLAGTKFHSDFVHVLPAFKYLWQPKSRIIFSAAYDMQKRVPSVKALNPTEDRSGGGTVVYGNPDLNPETSQRLNVSVTWSKGRWLLRLTSANRYSSDLILAHDFLDSDALRHITYSNAARRMENSVSLYMTGRMRRVSLSAFVSGNYVDYDAYKGIAGGNSGWYLNTNASVEYSAPRDWYLRLSGNFNTGRVYFQSDGSCDFGYALAVSRNFMKNRLMVTADASSFLPVHYTRKHNNFAPGYRSLVENRYYHASFSLRVTYKFGGLKAKVKGDNVNVSNGDIKSSFSE